MILGIKEGADMGELLIDKTLERPGNGILLLYASLVVLIIGIVMVIIWLRYRKRQKSLVEDANRTRAELASLEKQYDELSIQKNLLDGRIEELRKTKERISRIAYTDALTGLPNRNAASDLLSGIMQTLSSKETVGVMLINISNFSEINDLAGYPGGEELLIDVTHKLSGVLGEDDYLARFDTDRFMVITQKLEDIDEYEKKLKLILSVFSDPFILSQRECFADISIGIALAPQDGDQPGVLVRYVQMALDKAKEQGRNNYVYFDSELVRCVSDRMELQAEFKRAVEEQNFELMYRPQLTKSGEKTSRLLVVPYLNCAERGRLELRNYMGIVQDDFTIVRIGEYVIENICTQFDSWRKRGIAGMTLLVQVTERELFDRTYYEFARECIERYSVGNDTIEFVIDAKVLLRNREGLEEVVDSFKSLGIGFWLKGLGGYVKRMGLGIEKDCSYGGEMSVQEAEELLLLEKQPG